jgi:hypothetical protein
MAQTGNIHWKRCGYTYWWAGWDPTGAVSFINPLEGRLVWLMPPPEGESLYRMGEVMLPRSLKYLEKNLSQMTAPWSDISKFFELYYKLHPGKKSRRGPHPGEGASYPRHHPRGEGEPISEEVQEWIDEEAVARPVSFDHFLRAYWEAMSLVGTRLGRQGIEWKFDSIAEYVEKNLEELGVSYCDLEPFLS